MKIVLYGGGDAEDNRELDSRMLSLIPKKRADIQIAYIPSTSFEADIYFLEFMKQYKKFGIKKFVHFPIDISTDNTLANLAFNSDMIHLSGGNTYEFLKISRRFKLREKLHKFLLRGGVLTGLSAGAILLTPSIDTAGFPEFDKDDNEVGIKNLSAFSFVNFHFFPHYKNSDRYRSEMIRFSKGRKLFSLPEGSGIVINGEKINYVGKLYSFCDQIEKRYIKSRFGIV